MNSDNTTDFRKEDKDNNQLFNHANNLSVVTSEQKQLALNKTVSDMSDPIHGSAIINVDALLLTRLPCTEGRN